MASVFMKRGRWYARYRNAAGRWTRKVTACTRKRDAQRLADDMERRAERQRAGLDPLPSDAPTLTFGELAAWWMREYGSRLRSCDTLRASLDLHLLPALGTLALGDVTPARLEGLIHGKADTLAPKTLNGLRGLVHRMFKLAGRRGLWAGLNPAAAVERRKVQRPIFDSLRAEEVGPFLAAVPDKWRPLFATAIWTGLRKGELLGLQRVDVDLSAGAITVRHSYDRDTTKGGHADVIPIADPLRPYFKAALLASGRSVYVFPADDEKGSMRGKGTSLDDVLRRALRSAGLVTGWRHICRRGRLPDGRPRAKGCGHVEQHADGRLRLCPHCGMKLWPSATLRHVRFHDLRATCATLLARAGVPLTVAQRVLRHSDPRLTANVYTRVDLGDMREGVNRMLPVALPAAAGAPPVLAFVPPVSPRGAEGAAAVDGRSANASGSAGLNWRARRDLNSQPSGSKSVPGAQPIVSPDCTASQAGDNTEGGRPPHPGGGAGDSAGDAGFVPSLSPRSAPLLTARECAARLGLHPATVRDLCDAGELPHVRILNLIRVAPEDLEAFIAARRVAASPRTRAQRAPNAQPAPDAASAAGERDSEAPAPPFHQLSPRGQPEGEKP